MEAPIVSVIVAVIENPEGKVLVLKRAPDKKWAPNLWNIISGTIEEGEEPQQAVFREVQEEVAMKVELIETFPVYDVPFEGKIFRTYAYKFLTKDAEPTLDREHTEFRWVTFQELPGLELVPIIFEDLKKMGYL